MRNIVIVLFVLTPLVCKSQTWQNKSSQDKKLHSSINVTGGDLSSEAGSVSYSIGQVYYLSYSDKKDYVSEGIQQPSIIEVAQIKKEEKDFKVVAYPNPVDNYFVIEAATYTNQSLVYHLIDLHNTLLKEGRIGESGAKVDISTLPASTYLLQILGNGKLIKTIIILKN